jgi:RHS repeat-associated protein
VGTNQCLQTAALPVADRTLSFVYGPEHQRIKQNITLTSNGTTEHKHYLKVAGITFALFTSRTGKLNSLPATTTSYFHHDQLGSISAITNELGAVTERLAYDPWGKRRFINTTPGATDKLDAIVGLRTDRGFTEHEHLDEMGVVHMNGRIYDPLIGRFMSADPFIQVPDNLQSYNRYAYVMNNPLTLVDPSGYFSLRKVFRAVVVIAVAYYTGQWIGEALISSATSGFIAGTSGLSTGLVTLGGQAGVLTGLGSAIAGAAGGFAAGVLSSGTLEGGLQGALTGGAFGFVGGTWAAGTPGNYAGHAVVGCVSSVAGGGQCGSGAASAVFGKYVTNATSSLGAGVAHFTATVVAGGVGSVIAGGKFENGAKTAAYGYLFNELLTQGNRLAAQQRAGYKETSYSDGTYCNIQGSPACGSPSGAGSAGDSQEGPSVGFTAAIGVGVSTDTALMISTNGSCAVIQTSCVLAGPIAGITRDVTFLNISSGTPGDGWSVGFVNKYALPVGGSSISGGYGSDGASLQVGRSFGTIYGSAVKACTQRTIGGC